MPYCPNCRTEYEAGSTVCADCGAALVNTLPPEEADDPVVVLEANSVTEAQVAEATLEAEGIDAYVQAPASLVPNVDPSGDEPPELEVLVAPEDAAAADQILSQPPPSDEELTSLADSSATPGQEP